eukprot:7316230-Pyramimonas_sp.AAC.1
MAGASEQAVPARWQRLRGFPALEAVRGGWGLRNPRCQRSQGGAEVDDIRCHQMSSGPDVISVAAFIV